MSASWCARFVVAVFVVVTAAAGTAWAAEKIEGRLIVEDVMARPGTAVTLKAALLEDGMLGARGLGGEVVTFVVEGRRAGTALTGGDGRAFLEFTTHMRGNHTIVARVDDGPRVTSAEGAGTLASWERRRPILLVDVATLLRPGAAGDPLPTDSPLSPSLPSPLPALSLPDLSNLPFVGSAPLGAPLEEARLALSRLAEFYYNIIYVHDRRDTVLHETREWLRRHTFPAGMTELVSRDPTALPALMDRLNKGGWDNLKAGVGRTRDFAQTLVKRRLTAVIFSDPAETRPYPRRANIVTSWTDVRKHL